MKFFPSVIIAFFGVAWALPAQEVEREIYIPCSTTSIFDAAYCCERGILGDVSAYASTPFHNPPRRKCAIFRETLKFVKITNLEFAQMSNR